MTDLLTAICAARSQVTMRKELEYTIEKKDDGLMVKAVLSKQLHLSRREISRLKFSNGLLLNNAPCRVTETVHTGDVIHLIFMEKDIAHAVRLTGKPDIIYEDEDLVIVNKPAGMPCHPSHEHLDDDMGTLLQNYYKDQFTIRAIGRLDKDVSGIMLYAKNQPSAARLSKQRQAGKLNKYYLAICSGHFEKKSGTLQYALEKRAGHKERIVSGNGQMCITEYRVVEESDVCSLLQVHIITGRTHQIRAGMAWTNHPLVGDKLYGGDMTKLHRPALHCAVLDLEQPFTGKPIHVECPLPEEMEGIMKKSVQ